MWFENLNLARVQDIEMYTCKCVSYIKMEHGIIKKRNDGRG